jgi:hypothetical protein
MRNCREKRGVNKTILAINRDIKTGTAMNELNLAYMK